MAKQIIVLDQNSDGTNQTYRFAMWYSVNPSTASPQASGSQWTGASATDNQAIQAGTIKEEIYFHTFPVGTPTTAIKPVVQQAWTARNAQINNIGPNQYYGVFFDSATGWSA